MFCQLPSCVKAPLQNYRSCSSYCLFSSSCSLHHLPPWRPTHPAKTSVIDYQSLSHFKSRDSRLVLTATLKSSLHIGQCLFSVEHSFTLQWCHDHSVVFCLIHHSSAASWAAAGFCSPPSWAPETGLRSWSPVLRWPCWVQSFSSRCHHKLLFPSVRILVLAPWNT